MLEPPVQMGLQIIHSTALIWEVILNCVKRAMIDPDGRNGRRRREGESVLDHGSVHRDNLASVFRPLRAMLGLSREAADQGLQMM